MTVRNSLLVWVSGAVIGWVVAVMVLYSILRAPDEVMITDENRQERPVIVDQDSPEKLNFIMPASGMGKTD